MRGGNRNFLLVFRCPSPLPKTFLALFCRSFQHFACSFSFFSFFRSKATCNCKYQAQENEVEKRKEKEKGAETKRKEERKKKSCKKKKLAVCGDSKISQIRLFPYRMKKKKCQIKLFPYRMKKKKGSFFCDFESSTKDQRKFSSFGHSCCFQTYYKMKQIHCC